MGTAKKPKIIKIPKMIFLKERMIKKDMKHIVLERIY